MVVRDNTDCRNAFDVKELRHPSSIKVLSMFSSENQWVYLIALLPVTTSQAGHGRAYGGKEPTVADLGSAVA